MTASIEQIAKEAIDLPRHQRLVLVRLLLDLDRAAERNDVDSAWDAELRARIEAVDANRLPEYWIDNPT